MLYRLIPSQRIDNIRDWVAEYSFEDGPILHWATSHPEQEDLADFVNNRPSFTGDVLSNVFHKTVRDIIPVFEVEYSDVIKQMNERIKNNTDYIVRSLLQVIDKAVYVAIASESIDKVSAIINDILAVARGDAPHARAAISIVEWLGKMPYSVVVPLGEILDRRSYALGLSWHHGVFRNDLCTSAWLYQCPILGDHVDNISYLLLREKQRLFRRSIDRWSWQLLSEYIRFSPDKVIYKSLVEDRRIEQKTSIGEQISRMGKVSSPEYEQPGWLTTQLFKNYSVIIGKVLVFYDQGDDLETVKTLVDFRYNRNTSEIAFNTGTNGNIKSPVPNIAICTQLFLDRDSDESVNIYDAFGLEFDSINRQDYKYYIKENKQSTKKLVFDVYIRIFKHVFKVAEYLEMNEIVISLVGGKGLAYLYKDEYGEGILHFQRNIWLPAFLQVRVEHPRIKIRFMGAYDSFISSELGEIGEDVGCFPDNMDEVKTKRALFVNNRDSWSFERNEWLHKYIAASVVLSCWQRAYPQKGVRYIALQ